MTPAEMALIHARCFRIPRPWSASEFADLLDSPLVFVAQQHAGFVLGRVIADEAELLTLAVAPDHQRQGIGRHLLRRYEALAIEWGATVSFLEVAEDNTAAIALYQHFGYHESGCRKGYYRACGEKERDALLYSKSLKPA